METEVRALAGIKVFKGIRVRVGKQVRVRKRVRVSIRNSPNQLEITLEAETLVSLTPFQKNATRL